MDSHIIVSNSSPIILLEKIGQIDLLRKLFSTVYIAHAVCEEVFGDKSKYDWIKVGKVRDMTAKKMFSTSLHGGEIETMLLAIEMSAGLCILDDLLARKHAKRLDLSVTGTLGIIVLAKRKGLINEVSFLINQLRDAGMYIGDDLYKQITSM